MNFALAQAQMDQIMTIFERQFDASVQRFQQHLKCHHPGIKKAVTELYRIKEYHEEDILCKDIDHVIEALEEEHKAVGLLDISYKDSPFDHAIQRYAQLSSQHLSNQIHARLPRELRNIIYSYIWTKDYLEKSVARMRLAVQGINHPPFGPLPHVIEPTYANPIVAREAMEAYYHCAAGIVDVFVAENPAWLPSILHGDVFN
ncbi:hypothetical protein PTT_18427 [Pyrenophora teres f. teres 0-1]|uniref:Uncharacterized protein n=1 Tax=Pyrenophora teres f. teres (strain 0-1) TaxID=861557 RepID=E3S6P7_PYRTT|nr:hypothetical protein PTT_18427 [Pyrenophora teres f. teres 0-1]